MVVGLFVFALLAAAVLAMLLTTARATKDSEARVVAANLAASQIEVVRGQRATSVADGTWTQTVEGREYTVTQTSSYGAGDSGSDTCGEGIAYRTVNIEVSWPDMGTTTPVRSDTTKAVGIGELDPDGGVLAVRVDDAEGAGNAGVQVQLDPTSRAATTDSDGCAVFEGLDADTYSVDISAPGHVGWDREPVVTADVDVLEGRTSGTGRVPYDRAAALTVGVTATNGWPVPSTVGVSVQNSRTAADVVSLPDCSQLERLRDADGNPVDDPDPVPGRNCVESGDRTVGDLFPFDDGWAAWAGTCADSRPADTGDRTVVTAGGTGTVSVGTGRLQTRVKVDRDDYAEFVDGFYLVAVSTCGTFHVLGTLDEDLIDSSNGQRFRYSLPQGTFGVAVFGTDYNRYTSYQIRNLQVGQRGSDANFINPWGT